jgi:hypothetical protein
MRQDVGAVRVKRLRNSGRAGMDMTSFLGWVAALFVLTSFSLKTMTSLRLMAAVSNVTFIAYGLSVGSLPILVLHTLLFPLNIVRLLQARRLQQEVEAVSRHNDIIALLMPHMQRGRIAAGQILFRQGETSDILYFILEGQILLQQSGHGHGANDLIGVMGCFTPDCRRLDTAMAVTQVELCSVPTQKVRELMLQDARVSSYLLRTISHRAAGNFKIPVAQ